MGAAVPVLATAGRPSCPDLPISGQGRIKQIYDGDTVQLKDGRKVRLLGINTPEIDHQQGRSEAYSVAARQRLQTLLPQGARVNLQIDSLHHDRYGRLLAHLQTETNRNPALTLLREGLATTLILPPNTAAAACFTNAEQQARANKLGIWSQRKYQPRRVTDIADIGYQVIAARVGQVNASKHYHYLDTADGLTLRINKQQWLQYFSKPFPPHWPGASSPDQLAGQTLTIRGWVTRYRPNRNRGWQLRLYHPAGVEWQP